MTWRRVGRILELAAQVLLVAGFLILLSAFIAFYG